MTKGPRGLQALVVALLGAWSCVSVAVVLAEVPPGGTLTGADGPFAADQLQYMAWVRDSGSHLLAGDLFRIPPGDRVFAHPMWLPSGLLWSLGLPIAVAVLLWKPLAASALGVATWRYVTKMLGAGPMTTLAVVALALFYFSPVAIVVDSAPPLAGEAFSAGQLWGYLPTVLAVALMPAYLLSLEAALTGAGGERRRALGLTCAAGLLIAWLHPWQGQVMVLVTLGLAAWDRTRGTWRVAAVAVAATAAPLLAYFLLSRVDDSWAIAQSVNVVDPPPLRGFLATVAPLAAVAALGVRRPGADVQERALLLWPAAMLACYFALSPSFPAHAIEGIAIPLAVLAARAVQRLPAGRPWALAALVTALTVPGSVWVVGQLDELVGDGRAGHVLSAPQRAALAHLSRGSGGVLATGGLQAVVPVWTGRPTWVGHPSWTPEYLERSRFADQLARDEVDAARARSVVAGSGARSVVIDCGGSAGAGRLLGDLVREVRRFGCVTVYELARTRAASAAMPAAHVPSTRTT